MYRNNDILSWKKSPSVQLTQRAKIGVFGEIGNLFETHETPLHNQKMTGWADVFAKTINGS